jgi:hypothetical protein
VLDCTCDVTQTAASARILHLAGTETVLHLAFDDLCESRFTRFMNLTQNVLSRIVEAVAQRNRVFRFFDADAHLHIRFAEDCLTGEINDIARRRSAEQKGTRPGYAGVIAHKTLHRQRGDRLTLCTANWADTRLAFGEDAR